ncbi:SIMPL domain-containing protein [Syntrophomonas erecta]
MVRAIKMSYLVAFLVMTLWLIGGLNTPVQASPATTSRELTPVVVVSANAEVSVPPDQAIISLVVNNTDKSLNQAQYENTCLSRQVIQALTKEQISSMDLHTLNYSIYPQYNYESNLPPVLTGYLIRNEVLVIISDFDKLDQILHTAINSGADCNFIRFEPKNITTVENLVLEKALHKCHEKAAIVAATAERTLGSIIDIEKDFSSSGLVKPLNTKDFNGMILKKTVPLPPEDVKVSSHVIVTFELK